MNESIQNQPGVFVPAHLLQHPALTPAIFYTWMQLRLLVGDQAESAPVSIAETEAYTGKSRSALYTHLTALRRAELIDWRFAARRMLVFSLPGVLDAEKLDQETGLQSGNLDQSKKVDQLSGLQINKLDRGNGIESNNTDYSKNLDQLSGLRNPKIWTRNSGNSNPIIRTIPKIWTNYPDSNPISWTGVMGSNPINRTIPKIWTNYPDSNPKIWTGVMGSNPIIRTIPKNWTKKLDSSPENWTISHRPVRKTGLKTGSSPKSQHKHAWNPEIWTETPCPVQKTGFPPSL